MRWLRYGVLLLLVAGVLALSYVDLAPIVEAISPAVRIDGPALARFLRSLGGWAVAGALGLMVVHSFLPFPAEFIAMANGMVYGPLWGTAITWFGALLGAWAAFGLTRVLGRPFVERLLSPRRVARLDRWVREAGVASLLLARLVPLISFNLINYAAGLTRLPWWSFTWTTALGILPITVLMVAVGSSVRVLPWWGWLLLLAALAAALYAIRRRARERAA